MSMLVTAGAVDVTTYFHLRLAADGTDATGLTITNIDLQYTRSGATPAAKVDATALGAANSAHSDNTAFEIDGTDQPGVYRVDWPDAAFASGVDEVILTVKCATVFTESLRVRLMSATRGLSGTALPNAAADAAGGLPISDAGGLDMDAKVGALTYGTANRVNVQVYGMEANVITATAINADAITDAKVAADVTIASVTGAVGSVTGAVGSVTGAVGSVAAGGITAASFAANAINAAKLDPDVTTELQSGLATSAAVATLQTSVDDLPTNAELTTALGTADDAVLSAVATVDDFLDTEVAAILAAVDTEVAAIKAKTDSLTFTVANVVDANLQRINDVTVNGDGSGTPWGP
jgi:hypothetical protein